MKKKKSFSKIDYYLLLFEEFKDQLTLVLCINILISFVITHFQNLYKTIYFQNHFRYDWLDTSQFEISEYAQLIGYIFLGSFFLHLVTYKANQYWIFFINSSVLVILTLLNWFVFSTHDLMLALRKIYWPILLLFSGQIILIGIWLNEIYQLIKQKLIRNTEHT